MMAELKECTSSYLNKQERLLTRMKTSMDRKSPNRQITGSFVEAERPEDTDPANFKEEELNNQ